MEVGAVRLYLRVVGDGADPVVVVHGGPGFSSAYFGDDLDELSASHAVVFYDQRGTGRSSLVSDAASLHVDRFVDDLDAVRRQLGLERLTLLAHSWGAAVAALYAQRWPARVDRLVIVGGIPLRRSELVRAFEELRAHRGDAATRALEHAAEAWRSEPGDAQRCRAYYRLWFAPFYGDPDAAERSTGDFCAGSAAALVNKLEAVDRLTLASLGEWDWAASLGGVTARVLVVHGGADPIPMCSARAWAAAFPNARLMELGGIGHFPYLEAPDRFFQAVEAFLSER